MVMTIPTCHFQHEGGAIEHVEVIMLGEKSAPMKIWGLKGQIPQQQKADWMALDNMYFPRILRYSSTMVSCMMLICWAAHSCMCFTHFAGGTTEGDRGRALTIVG